MSFLLHDPFYKHVNKIPRLAEIRRVERNLQPSQGNLQLSPNFKFGSQPSCPPQGE